MNFVGIDLHKRRSHIAALSDDGRKLLSRRIDNDPATFLELLSEVDGESKIALEATYGWEWLADVLEEAGYELHLAHPLRTKAIASARVKTDSVDALTLAHLLRTDLLPEAYIAPRELRDLRDLLRHRVALTHMRSALKNRVHALIARQGIRHEHTDLFGKAGIEFLSALELREPPRRRLDSLLALICDFDREIAATTREIDQRARRDERVDVLCQIRGVGPYTAMLVIAEIGDISRFRKARKLCAWAGLTPTVRSSDGKARLGHISRQGSRPLRWALVEAAQHSVRGGGPLRDDFERIAKRRGRKIAKVAVARKILTLCYYGLRDGEIRCLARRCRPGARAVMAASS
jgi:transposase